MRLVLYAVSTPHAAELVETVRRLGWEIVASVRNQPQAPVPDGLGAVITPEELTAELRALPSAVPQTDPDQRHAATAAALADGLRERATLIDPTAILAGTAEVGPGSYVGAGAVLGAGCSLGEGVLINRSCSIAHHVRFGDFATTGPGVVLAGSCRIGGRAFLGAGAVLAPEVEVGHGAVVGAGAVVIRDVPPGAVVVGNPARELRRRSI